MLDYSRLAPPPRPVPLSLVLLGLFHVGTQVLLVVMGFAMLCFWAFAMHADLSALTFRGPTAMVAARITGVDDTHSATGGGHIWANHYAFSLDGRPLNGLSYGEARAPGSLVSVEYREANPADSRIVGMRRDQFGPGALVMLIFPLMTGIVLLVCLRFGRSNVELLRNGIIADAVLCGRDPTRYGPRLQFDFKTRDGAKGTASRIEAGASSWQSERDSKFPNGTIEPVLYNPADPSKACMLTDSANRFSLNADGQLASRARRAVGASIIPLMFIAGNVLAACSHFGIHLW
jgi:hypothetical protein